MIRVSEVIEELKQQGRQYFPVTVDTDDLEFVMQMQGLAFTKQQVVQDGQKKIRIKLSH